MAFGLNEGQNYKTSWFYVPEVQNDNSMDIGMRNKYYKLYYHQLLLSMFTVATQNLREIDFQRCHLAVLELLNLVNFSPMKLQKILKLKIQSLWKSKNGRFYFWQKFRESNIDIQNLFPQWERIFRFSTLWVIAAVSTHYVFT